MKNISINREVKQVLLNDIKPNPNNPRAIKSVALEGLRASIKKFGLIDLLVVNKRTMEIISGHQRYKILIQEGVKEEVCVVVDVDRVEQEMMALSLNNQEITGYWTASIEPILESIKKNMPDAYLDLRLKELYNDVEGICADYSGLTDPDDIPDERPSTDILPGDLFQLGAHRLLCGDSTRRVDIDILLGGYSQHGFYRPTV